MKNLEQLHLEAIEQAEYEEIKNSAIYKIDFGKAASKSAEITEQIAIEFVLWTNSTNDTVVKHSLLKLLKGEVIDYNFLFQEYLKTKKL